MDKKELKRIYSEMPVIGGIFKITNAKNGKILIDGCSNLKGAKNKFDFCVTTNTFFDMKLKSDWSELGGKAFNFEVVEELQKKPEQTDKEFKEDIELLKQIWQDKLGENNKY